MNETERTDYTTESGDLERGTSGVQTFEEKITYVAISPDGSIVATFNPYGFFITIKKVATNDETKIRFDRKKFFDKKPPNDIVLGWSLAVSDTINNDIGLVAISCITGKDMNPNGIYEINKYQIALIIVRRYIDHIKNLFVHFDRQFRLSLVSSEGTTKLFKYSFKNRNNTNDININTNDDDNSIYKYRLGGVVGFLKNSKNSSKNVTLVCMNCIKMQKMSIELNELNADTIILKEDCYILPENLFKELESVECAKFNWKYLLKSRYQEFLMVDTSDYQQIQSIEIYNINTSQLVNVFYRYCKEEDSLISRNHEPGIFAVSTDSRLFAYSYGDNIITIYLMESGLEVVSKKFNNNIYKIKFLEFIEDNEKLFIIEEDKESDVKFHVWLISGCLNDYFPISEKDIKLSDDEITTLLKYDDNYHNLTKANGNIVILFDNDEKSYEGQFRVISKIKINKSTFGENNTEKRHKFSTHELEPWNTNNGKKIHGRFLNDGQFLLITGQKSIQLWKSKNQNYENYDDFNNFENSNLVYILIDDNIEHEKASKFQIEDNMITIIIHACKSLAYLYRHTDSINSKEKNQKFVSGITNIIKDFINKYPDYWKLMEIQYPLMAYLIYSRSFSLIKYVLFENAEKLHRPQQKYGSYPCYDNLKLNDDLGLQDNDLRSANDLELALKFCQDQDAVMLAYLLEYYAEHSMGHIGWMINVTKILPELSKHDYANYVESLYYKPCFGKMKYNLPIKTFDTLSVSQDTLEVYIPLTQLISTDYSTILKYMKYKKIRDDLLPDICMVPLPNFTNYYSKIKGEIVKEEIFRKLIRKLTTSFWWIKVLIPPSYKDLNNKDFSPFLQIKKNKSAFFNIPSMESVIISRWRQTKNYSNTFIKINGIDDESIIFATSVTALILWIEMLLCLRLFSGIAINIYIFGSILEKVLPFFTFMFVLIVGFGHSMFILFGFPSIVDLHPSASNLTGGTPDNPFDTPLDAILSTYNWSTINLGDYNYWPLKLFAFIASIILVLILLNMIIALMNDTFNNAKEDGKFGLLVYRSELIDDYERLNNPFFSESLYNNSPYICYYRDPDLMKKWIKKSQELKDTKLYSWFNESVDKENIIYDDEVQIKAWYKLISDNENQDSPSTPDYIDLDSY
ncbi:7539_t:CDS:10 [Rhizophagus irregularis]|nr:7539_t:CDS:10 [Rhizophagus irregularis]